MIGGIINVLLSIYCAFSPLKDGSGISNTLTSSLQNLVNADIRCKEVLRNQDHFPQIEYIIDWLLLFVLIYTEYGWFL